MSDRKLHKEFRWFQRDFSNFAKNVVDRLVNIIARIDGFSRGTAEDPVVTVAVGVGHDVFP